MILTNLLTTAVQWIDLLMVARLGKQSIAAVGLSGFLTTLLWSVLMALQIGVQIVVAQAWGAGDRRTIGRSVQAAAALGVGFAIVVTAVFSSNPWLLQRAFLAFDTESAVAQIGATYMRITLIVLPGMIFTLVAQAALRAAGDTRTPLWLTGLANVVNAGLNYVLIFGKLGMPELGVAGAAWGTVIARALEACAYLVLLYSGQLRVSLERRLYSWDLGLLRRLLHLGAPAALEQGVITLGFLLYNRVMASYGTDALAAYQIGVILLQAAFMPGFGFSVAATTLVGQWVGGGSPAQARLAGERCRWLAVGLMTTLGIAFFAFARPFSAWILDDPGVVEIAVLFIRALALAQPFMAVHFALSGALRGAGDVRSPLYAALVAMYAVRLPISMIAAFVLEGPILWCFVAMIAAHMARATVLDRRWRRGTWEGAPTA